MSGFLSHIAARGMGQAGAVHSAARLSYASAPALLETGGEAMALPPSARSLSQSGPAQGPAQGQMPTRPNAAPEGIATATPRPPAPLLQRPVMLSPAATDADLRDDHKAPEATENRPLPSATDSAIGAIPDPIMPAVAHPAREASAADDEAPAPLRRIQPLLPPQQGTNGTPSFKVPLGVPGSSWRAPVEETTEVHVSIGRIEVTAVHEAAPTPKRAPARGQRALSLEEYLARRKAGRS